MKCVRLSERGNANLNYEPCTICQGLALTADSVQHADEIIQTDQCVKYGELLLQLGISDGSVSAIIQEQ
jgi:hypothetical protein